MLRRGVLVVLVAAAALPLAGVVVIGSAGVGGAIAAGTVTARISLPATRLPARSTVHGHLVLTNSGDLPVDLNQGCTPKWEVLLGRGAEPPGGIFTAECSPEPFVVKPGTTRLPFDLRVGRRKPGRARAFLVASDPSFPTAPPVRVTVVRAR